MPLAGMALELHFFLWVFRVEVCAVVKKVLVVDDSQAEIRLLQSVLQQGGFHSVAISDPTKIEEAIEEERPNVILAGRGDAAAQWLPGCRDLKSQHRTRKFR